MKITWAADRWTRYWAASGAISALYTAMGMPSAPSGPVWAQYRRRRIAIIRAHRLRFDDFKKISAHRRRLRRGWGRSAYGTFNRWRAA